MMRAPDVGRCRGRWRWRSGQVRSDLAARATSCRARCQTGGVTSAEDARRLSQRWVQACRSGPIAPRSSAARQVDRHRRQRVATSLATQTNKKENSSTQQSKAKRREVSIIALGYKRNKEHGALSPDSQVLVKAISFSRLLVGATPLRPMPKA